MGASLPLLSRAIVADVDGAARTIGILYGLNTFGAALGAALSSWLFIGLVGFEGTIRIGALGNLLAALGAILLVRGASLPRQVAPTRTSVTKPIAPPQTEVRFGLPAWCALYALAGFIALSLELLWFRILDVMIKSSPYMFGPPAFLLPGFSKSRNALRERPCRKVETTRSRRALVSLGCDRMVWIFRCSPFLSCLSMP